MTDFAAERASFLREVMASPEFKALDKQDAQWAEDEIDADARDVESLYLKYPHKSLAFAQVLRHPKDGVAVAAILADAVDPACLTY